MKISKVLTILLIFCAISLSGVAQEEDYDGITSAQLENIAVGDSVTMSFRFVATDTSDIIVDNEGRTIGKISGFFIGSTEVTQQQWTAVMGQYPFSQKGPGLPATGMSLRELHNFVDKIDSLTQTPLRLPTLTEWITAARGGENYPYPGDSNVRFVAWYKGNSNELHPVAQKVPNAYGLYDMSGNAAEWVAVQIKKVSNQMNDTISSFNNLYQIVGGNFDSSDSDCVIPSYTPPSCLQDSTSLYWKDDRETAEKHPLHTGFRLIFNEEFYKELK